MAPKKPLSVPQNGTQPAVLPTPMDNMLSSGNQLPQQSRSDKRPTSFNLDQQLVKQFKATCAARGLRMTSVIEELISSYIAGNNG